MTDRKTQTWHELRFPTPERLEVARLILDEVREGRKVMDAVRSHPLPGGGYIGKNLLVAVYRQLTESGDLLEDTHLLSRIRLKPIRTLSGVTTVTVLTKPYPCPGECIFCPTDVRMPKSYLPEEPGARRGLEHEFDPYNQTSARLRALEAVGHPTEKIELLILGGTWSAYRRDYQEWFIQRCFDAINGKESSSLSGAQQFNETTRRRNVGLVIETRPDYIDVDEIHWLRYLGVTKVQIGAQSFNDQILEINKRGHSAAETQRAVDLLRAAGYKIVLHWMPNLLGATLESDRVDFDHMWNGFCPDEIKIYPNQLLKNTELFNTWKRGEYQPYSTDQLIELIADVKETIPRYCRVNRIVRDIPSTYVVAGNKRSSLRQDVQRRLSQRGLKCECVRCREVRGWTVDLNKLKLDDLIYSTRGSEEHFLSFTTTQDRLAGLLRLSLPNESAPNTGLSDLENAAIIREVHVYGQSLPVGSEENGAAQHIGLGARLIQEAEEIARRHRFKRLAVISAVGTRQYYSRRGFSRGEFYMLKELG